MAQSDTQDHPYDPSDPSTWLDPSGNPIDPGAGQSARAQMLSAVDPGSYDPTGASAGQPDMSNGPTAPATPSTSAVAGGLTPGPGLNKLTPEEQAQWDAIQTGIDKGPTGPTQPGGGTPYGYTYGTTDTTTPIEPSSPGYVPPTSIAPDPATAAYNAQLRAFMLSQLSDLSTPTDANSPDVAPSISAYNNQSTRDQQAERDAVTERFYAQGEGGGEGLSSGGFNTAVTQGAEAAGANRANFSGNLVYNASQSKRSQLQALLQTAVTAGDTQSAQDIQAQIATIDGQLRSQGLNQQNSQFNDQLAEQYANLQAQMNRDQLLAALGQGG